MVGSSLDIEATVKRVADEEVKLALAKRHRGEPPERILSFVSKSHALVDSIVQGRVTFGHDFFFELVDPVDSEAFHLTAPAKSADENNDHHRYFLQEAKKLVNSALCAGRKISQQILWTKSGRWLSLDDKNAAGVEPDFCTIDVDDSKGNVENGRRYVKEDSMQIPSKYDVGLAFEQKKGFTKSDHIDAIDYGERLLRIQRGREVVYTALFHCCVDDKIIRWMKVSLGEGHYVTKVSRPASLGPSGEGQQQLLTMLSKTTVELGRIFPNLGNSDAGDLIKISFIVGEGATSIVYMGLLGGRAGILKVMKDGFEILADHEAFILNLLHANDTPCLSNVTYVKEGVLFFDEVLRPIRHLTATHVKDMVSCLKYSHGKAMVVHRDIRPDNIMEDTDGTLRIIDWGFAYVLNSDAAPPELQGTFRYASDSVLEAAMLQKARYPEPQDDLESVVRVVAAMGNLNVRHELARIEDGDFCSAKAAWARHQQQMPRLAELSAFAADLSYDKVAQILL